MMNGRREEIIKSLGIGKEMMMNVKYKVMGIGIII